MSDVTVRRLAITVGVAAVVLYAADLTMIGLVGAPADEGRSVGAALWTVGLSGAPIVGLLIAVRRPSNRYGWLLLSFGFFTGASGAAGRYADYLHTVHGGAHPWIVPAAMAESLLWVLFPMHLPMLLLLFPDGRLPTPRWRWLPRVVVASGLAAVAVGTWMPGELGLAGVDNPYAAQGAAGTAVQAIVFTAVIACFLCVLPAAVSLRRRRKHADDQERLQLRWFMWAAGLVAAVLVGTGAGAFIPNEVVNSALFASSLLALFVAIGIAVTRYRLYEIDRIISRTVTYGALTLLLAGIYLGAVTVLTTATASRAGNSPIAVAAATLAAAAAFGPARRRIQGAVDRRFNRSRYDAERIAAAYRARLRDQLDLESITDDLVATTGAAVQPSGVLVWLRQMEAQR